MLLCWSAISNQRMLFENLNLPGKVLYAPLWSRVFHGWGRKGSQSEVVHAYMMFVLVLKEVVISYCKESAQVDHRIVCFPFQSLCTRFAEWGFANVCAPVVLDVCCFSTIFPQFPSLFCTPGELRSGPAPRDDAERCQGSEAKTRLGLRRWQL